MLAPAEHSLRGLLEVRLFCEDVGRQESLRVAIDHREPGALNLRPDPVAFPESVVVSWNRIGTIEARRYADLIAVVCVPLREASLRCLGPSAW